MRIKIDLMIGLFLLLFSFTSQLEIYAVLMLFAIIHEIGHLCAGLLLGFKPREIKINPMGIQMEFEPESEEGLILKDSKLSIRKAIIALAGPLTNFIIIFNTIIITNLIPELKQINFLNINYKTIVYANLLIGIFNLIPIYPLDGGRIIKEVLHIILGFKKAYKATYLISKTTIIILTVFASICILYIHNISILIIVLYLWGLVIFEGIKNRKVEKYYKKYNIPYVKKT